MKERKNTAAKTRRTSCLVASALLAVSWLQPAVAQSNVQERFSLSLGLFLTDRGTQLRLAGDVEVPDNGTDVDFENDLGFDASESVFRIDGYFQFNEVHRIDFSAFDLSRSASQQIQKDIEWDGEIYPIDTVVSAGLDMTIYKLSYTWSFMRRERGFVGASIGAYVADIGTYLEANTLSQSSSHGLTAPMPVLGMRGQYDIADKWTLRGSAEYLLFDEGNFSGKLYDIYAGVDYQFFEHVAVGLGYNRVHFDIAVAKTNFNGDLDWRYDGALLFLKFDF